MCRQSGISYFSNPGVTTTTDNSEGMEFEPIAGDIDNDGINEIVIFSNSKLIIYNQSLGFLDEVDIGNLVGQPTIYNTDSDNNLEIIFIANVSSTSYLMAYQYNSGFTKECNLTVSNGASGSGIKCANIGSTESCFFKDQQNVFYNINMSNSCTQTANLTTNNQEDTTPTVPSILDYDKDDKVEGVWWFNNDSDQFAGIAVIELESMAYDTGFNKVGFIDDITQGSGSSYRAGFENLKGNPVFYTQDNGGGHEILVAYDNEKIAGGIGDEAQCYRSVLKTFDTDGTLLWTFRPAACGIGSSGVYYCDMSTPVVVDVDNDNYDDVCFILEGDGPCYSTVSTDYFYCIDRFGNDLDNYPKNTSDVASYGSPSASIDTNMYIADMDNDGEEEMVGAGYIWDLNGSILKGNYSSFTSFAPIPVDIDDDNVLELIGTKAGETSIFESNGTTADLEILEIIPIQVVMDVDMVLGKTGLVRVNVKNNGPLDVNGTVTVTFEGDTLSSYGNDTDNKKINNGDTVSFDFSFNPEQTGTQTFSAEVSVS